MCAHGVPHLEGTTGGFATKDLLMLTQVESDSSAEMAAVGLPPRNEEENIINIAYITTQPLSWSDTIENRYWLETEIQNVTMTLPHRATVHMNITYEQKRLDSIEVGLVLWGILFIGAVAQ